MIYVLIIGIIILILSIVALCNEETSTAYVLGILGSYMLSGSIMYFETVDKSPSAMDVYQGKTTMQYTYKDGIAVDSIVVFKNE